MSPDLAVLNQPFAEEELRTFTGRAGREFTYIEDETVMDRLDAAFGMGNWSILTEPLPIYEGVVKVKLGVRVDDDADWVWYEDYGYPSNKEGEALKEAVSDGIRRCGRYLGIARDLYRKDSPPVTRTPPKPPVIAVVKGGEALVGKDPYPARSSTDLPEGPDLDWDVLSERKPEPFAQRQAELIEPDGSWTYPQLAERAKALSVPIKVLGDTAKRLYGPNAWKLTDLTGEQRYAVAVEVGLL